MTWPRCRLRRSPEGRGSGGRQSGARPEQRHPGDPARAVRDLRDPEPGLPQSHQSHERAAAGLDRDDRRVCRDVRAHQRRARHLRGRRPGADGRGVREARRGRAGAAGSRWRARLAVGAAMGLVNALLVVRLGITPIIVTLGTLYVARGLAFLIAEGHSVVTGPAGLLHPPRPVVPRPDPDAGDRRRGRGGDRVRPAPPVAARQVHLCDRRQQGDGPAVRASRSERSRGPCTS